MWEACEIGGGSDLSVVSRVLLGFFYDKQHTNAEHKQKTILISYYDYYHALQWRGGQVKVWEWCEKREGSVKAQNYAI